MDESHDACGCPYRMGIMRPARVEAPACAPAPAAAWYQGTVTGKQTVAQVLAAERAATLQRLAGLERDRAAIIESSGPGGADDEHDPEGATIAFERQHLAALISQARGQLAQIDAAMIRLAGGSYGRCEGCGQPIGAARLAARPVTTVCIDCATAR